MFGNRYFGRHYFGVGYWGRAPYVVPLAARVTFGPVGTAAASLEIARGHARISAAGASVTLQVE